MTRHLPLDDLLVYTGYDQAVTPTARQTDPSIAFCYLGENTRDVPSPLSTLAEVLGVHRRTTGRWAVTGISLYQAEKACDVLGIHPCEVWGDAWIEAVLGKSVHA